MAGVLECRACVLVWVWTVWLCCCPVVLAASAHLGDAYNSMECHKDCTATNGVDSGACIQHQLPTGGDGRTSIGKHASQSSSSGKSCSVISRKLKAASRSSVKNLCSEGMPLRR